MSLSIAISLHRFSSKSMLRLLVLLLLVACCVSLKTCTAEKTVSYDGKLVQGLSNGKIIRFRRDFTDGVLAETLNTSTSAPTTTPVTLSSNATTNSTEMLLNMTTQMSFTVNMTSGANLMPTVTNITTIEILENATSFPVTQNTTSVPVSQSTTSVPVTQNTTSVPVTQSTASVPVTQKTTSVPVTQNTASVPVTQNTASVPVTQNTASVPVTQNTTSVPMASSTNASYSSVTSAVTNSSTTTPPHTTTEVIDDRLYYTVSYSKTAAEGRSYWRNIDGNKFTHHALNGRKKALQIKIPFNFTYYGHDVDRITIAISGFLYMSPFLHQYLSATQYIAPLMADFNSSIDDGAVYYTLHGDALVIEWRNVRLHTQPDAGPFNFQVQLFQDDGKIVFAYKNIPIPVKNISEEEHTVNVGIADAYYYDFGFIRTIHEYHKVEIDTERVFDDAAIIFTHKQTCNLQKDCNSCHNVILDGFNCFWCEDVRRCSDTKDRGRQQWYTNFCPFHLILQETCAAPTTTATTTNTTTPTSVTSSTTATGNTAASSTTTPTSVTNPVVTSTKSNGEGAVTSGKETCKEPTNNTAPPTTTTSPSALGVQKLEGTDDKNNSGRTAGIVIVVILLVLIASFVIFYIYSYKNPSSIPGQFLIKYRPSQLWRSCHNRGNKEDRYTVSTQVLTNDAYEG